VALPPGLAKLLTTLRTRARSTAEQGGLFEGFLRRYFLTDPYYATLFDDVWRWAEWPGRDGPDIGIDLVARERETGELWAIQAKFYDADAWLTLEDIATFLAMSNRTPFATRLIVSTAAHWSTAAERILADQRAPVKRLGLLEIAQSSLDWDAFDPERLDTLRRLERKSLLPHQREAVTDVLAGLADHARGQLLMPCGTGKTFTALQVAERLVREDGVVLFLAPSISLLAQTLREWSADAQRPLRSVVVCSDATTGRGGRDELEEHTFDLIAPTTTDPAQIGRYLRPSSTPGSLRVVFATYQSLDKIADAQAVGIVPELDLLIADEAHRTAGHGRQAGDHVGSLFQLTHDAVQLQARRRLYMTATAKVFAAEVKAQAHDKQVAVWSMDDEAIFGPILHRLTFGAAVDRDLLSDYRVLVLLEPEGPAAAALQAAAGHKQFSLQQYSDAAKLAACWRAFHGEVERDALHQAEPIDPMGRVVGYVGTIRDSKGLRDFFPQVAAQLFDAHNLEVRHVDGSQSALERTNALAWLRADPGDQIHMLTNVRCLSEGIDVPALDAVIFFAPRDSMVDVVQSVGRVMRKAPDKHYGYIVIPVPIAAGADVGQELSERKYQVIWQVLNAIRSHDERLTAEINQLKFDTGRVSTPHVEFIGRQTPSAQEALPFVIDEAVRDQLRIRLVERCGDRTYWADWAENVGALAQNIAVRITDLVERGEDAVVTQVADLLTALRRQVNAQVTRAEAIDLVAQHLVTAEVFEALLGSEDFRQANPVARAVDTLLQSLRAHGLDVDLAGLAGFYQDVRRRVAGITTPAGRQDVLRELYEEFFKRAFPKVADRLGIVYTPTELVDFLLASADVALRRHLGARLGDPAVDVIDPFVGTGTFLARLIEHDQLLSVEEASRKYGHDPGYELHANEIVLLAYYVAAANIEQAFARRTGTYRPFPGLVLTDTFALADRQVTTDEVLFAENYARITTQRQAPIQVVVANPPWAALQASENDANQNLRYGAVDDRIKLTYVARSTATLKNKLYDPYLRAFRWATDRIGERGVVALVTNASFIDARSLDGVRKCFADDFAYIYIVNLRGNQRTAGEESRREGGKVFGSGSRVPVALSVLVKDPAHSGPAEIRYCEVDDYLTREQKLGQVREWGSIDGVDGWTTITPNKQGDWLAQRDDTFTSLVPLRPGEAASVFPTTSNGLLTSRDWWVTGYSRISVAANVSRMLDVYERERQRYREDPRLELESVESIVTADPRQISWSHALKQRLRRDERLGFDPDKVVPQLYRPFTKRFAYFAPELNERQYQLPKLMPGGTAENRFILVTQPSSNAWACLATRILPDYASAGGATMVYPRFVYDGVDAGDLLAGGAGLHRRDAITDAALVEYRRHYRDESITSGDVFDYAYAILHHPGYRKRWADTLRLEYPRLPFAPDFHAVAQIGRALGDLHCDYEDAAPWGLEEAIADGAPHEPARRYHIERLRHPQGSGGEDLSHVVVNSYVTLQGIPEDTHRYVLGPRTALGWVLDQYRVRTEKASGITLDPNDAFSDNPHGIVELIGKVVRVSVETCRLVDALAAHPLE